MKEYCSHCWCSQCVLAYIYLTTCQLRKRCHLTMLTPKEGSALPLKSSHEERSSFKCDSRSLLTKDPLYQPIYFMLFMIVIVKTGLLL